ADGCHAGWRLNRFPRAVSANGEKKPLASSISLSPSDWKAEMERVPLVVHAPGSSFVSTFLSAGSSLFLNSGTLRGSPGKPTLGGGLTMVAISVAAVPVGLASPLVRATSNQPETRSTSRTKR